jgi:DNA invertase Pin-like site-specific DNA recombinase
VTRIPCPTCRGRGTVPAPGGRPRKLVDVERIRELREKGLSWPAIAREVGAGLGTVWRAYHAFQKRSGNEPNRRPRLPE